MNVVHDKTLRRFVWVIGLAFLVAGFATPVIGISSFMITIMLILELAAVYSLERRFIGVIGHGGFILSLLGIILSFNWKSYLWLTNSNAQQIVFYVWVAIAVFSIGCILFGVSTIRTGFVPAEIGYLLLITPAFLLLSPVIMRFALAVFYLAIGFFLMMFVSRRGEYDKKIATQQSVHPTSGILRDL